jgi:hypothetical protein
VSPDQLTEAGMEAIAKQFPAESLDAPRLHFWGRADFFWINRERARFKDTDLDATRAFYDKLVAGPPVRGQREFDIWLPARPGDPDAITYREHYRLGVRDEVDRLFARGPCE